MRNLITSAGILFACSLMAQNPCATTEMQNEWFAKNPAQKAQFEKLQHEAEELDKVMFKTGYQTAATFKKGAASNYTIPVVFHIMHTGGSENISDAQVKDAMRILNEDFNKLNSDTTNVVAQFKNSIGNALISFSLAAKDPYGKGTNGIIRHYDSRTDWQGNFSDYAYSWPRQNYLNIYVVKSIASGAAGYTYLPGTGIPQSADAIVILSTYVGSMGTGNTGTSRALTHEVGHWLNLPHVWGGTNQPGVACGDDGVSDTPITKGYTSCQLNNSAVCNPNIVENVQNYMDYAYCQRMFTTGQAARMQAAMSSNVSNRSNLTTYNTLVLTGLINPPTTFLTKLDVNTSATVICVGKSATVLSYTSNSAPTSYSWSSSGTATFGNPTAQNTSVTYNSPGVEVLTLEVTNSGGSTIQTITVTIVSSIADIAATNYESFEDPNYQLPVNWAIINNTSPAVTWEVYPYTASNGGACMMIPGENLPPNSIEILESPTYDFKNNPGAKFTFKYAYAKNSSSHKDVFKVQASNNCGGTWSDVYVPSNSTMAQNSGGITNNLYLTPAPQEWKSYDITTHPNFIPFVNSPNVKIRFYFQEDNGGTGYGNRFYLDEVEFQGSMTVGVNELTQAIALDVYPNPATDDVNLSFTLSDRSTVKYEVVSITGATAVPSVQKELESGSHVIPVNCSPLSPGVYFLQIEKDGVKMTKKLVIQ